MEAIGETRIMKRLGPKTESCGTPQDEGNMKEN